MERFTTNDTERPNLIDCSFCLEESNCYSNNKHCKAIPNALAKLRYYENLEVEERLLILPCKLGSTIYYISKACEENTGYQEWYKPDIEFDKDCKFYEPSSYCGEERCGYEDVDDPWYCSLDVDCYCDECVKRLCIRKDVFTLSKAYQIYNTPMCNKDLTQNEIFYLTYQEAKNALNKIIEAKEGVNLDSDK